MKTGAEDKKKLIAAGVLGVGALFAVYTIYSSFFGGTPTPPPPQPVVRTVGPAPRATGTATAAKVGTGGGALDPTLHMGPMLVTESLVYAGTGRNIFSGGPAAMPVMPKPIQPARPRGPQVAMTPPPVVPSGPPPINLKFFGTATRPDGSRQAFLLSGDDVFLARVGDVVARRYRVISIGANSVQIEDIPNSNQQAVPRSMN